MVMRVSTSFTNRCLAIYKATAVRASYLQIAAATAHLIRALFI